jgi:hypothetical protein
MGPKHVDLRYRLGRHLLPLSATLCAWAYWAVLRGGLDPERARVERLGEEPWRVGGEG